MTNQFKKIVCAQFLISMLAFATAFAGTPQIESYGSPAYTAFSSTNYSAAPGAAIVTITVTRSNNTSEPGSVNYFTADGSAVAGTDYAAANGRIDFAIGESSKTFSVQILQHRAPGTSFNVSLYGTTYSGYITSGNTSVTIQAVPRLQITPMNGGSVQIAWTADSGKYVVESSSTPGSSAWQAVTEAPSLVNGQNVIAHTCTGGLQFFRLRQL